MSPEEFKRRARDRVLPTVLIALVVSTALNAFVGFVALDASNTTDENKRALEEIKTERTQRSDETCRIFEQQQANDVDQLRRSYEFLADPPAALRGLVPYALAQLPRTVEEATEDDAPAYCDGKDEEGGEIGLPEPDSRLPRRPPNLPR